MKKDNSFNSLIITNIVIVIFLLSVFLLSTAILSVISTAGMLFCILILHFGNLDDKKRKLLRIINIGFFSMTILYGITADIAKQHGAETEYIRKTSVGTLIEKNLNTPKAETIRNVSTGDILVYYRYDCDDCKLIYHDLKKDTADLHNIKWISTRTNTGIALLNNYPVSQVPMLVLIGNGNLFTTADPVKIIGNMKIYDENALKELLISEQNTVDP